MRNGEFRILPNTTTELNFDIPYVNQSLCISDAHFVAIVVSSGELLADHH